jgi:hypothetical protein
VFTFYLIRALFRLYIWLFVAFATAFVWVVRVECKVIYWTASKLFKLVKGAARKLSSADVFNGRKAVS